MGEPQDRVTGGSGPVLARIPLPAMVECRAASLDLAVFYGPAIVMPPRPARTSRQRLWTLTTFGWLVRSESGPTLSGRGETFAGDFGVLSVDDLSVITSWTEIAVRAFLAGVATGQIDCRKISDKLIGESFDLCQRSVWGARKSIEKRGDTLQRISAAEICVARGKDLRSAAEICVTEPNAVLGPCQNGHDFGPVSNREINSNTWNNPSGKRIRLSHQEEVGSLRVAGCTESNPPVTPPSLETKKTGRDSCTNVRENESRGAGGQPTLFDVGCSPQQKPNQTAEHHTAGKSKSNGSAKKTGAMDAGAYEIPPSMDADETRKLLRRWFGYRRQIGKPYKLRGAVEAMLRKCDELDGNPVCRLQDAIEESMEHEWQGAFVERQEARWLDTDEDEGPYTQLTDEELQMWNPTYGFDPPPVVDFDYICKHWRP